MPDGPECEVDTDCGDPTLRCLEELCRSRCEGVVCEDEDEVCDPSLGECVGADKCEVSSDCGEKGECLDGQCLGARTADCTIRDCMPGLDCVEFGGLKCMAPCETGTECLVSERCLPKDTPLGTTVGNHCLYNACRPGGDELGLMQDAEYMGPCAASSESDGLCLGPFDGYDGEMGLCVAMNGQAHIGADCVPGANHGDEQACDQGICSDPAGVCSVPCTLFDGEICPDSMVCYPIWVINGYCTYPNATPAPGVGEPCAEGPGSKCGEDLGCSYSVSSDDNGYCAPLCTRTDEWAMVRPCEEGDCLAIQLYPDHVGVCSVQGDAP